MIFSYLLLLLPFSQAQPQPPPISEPASSPPAAPNKEEHQFVFENLPRICVECCMDIMFVVDRSDAVKGPTSPIPDTRVYWNRINALIADFGAGPLNHKKIRVGAMQMGDVAKISHADLANADSTGSSKTGIRFPLKSGPFPPELKGNWGHNDVFSSERAWKSAAEVALDHFTTVGNPWATDDKLCDPTQHVRLMIWLVAGGPKPASNDPCLGSPSVLSQLNEAEIQTHIVGVGDEWAPAIQGRRCMFSAGADTTGNLINAGKPIKEIGTLLKPSQLAVDPCNKCSGYVDVVFVLDESGSLCDNIPGNSSELKGICPKRTEFDLQVDFVGRIIAELGKSWRRHRVAIWSFATKMRNWVKLSQTGGKTAKKYPNGNKSYAWDKPMSEIEVQNLLPQIKAGFAEGYTATALAYKEALGEIEWVAPREDGKPAKKVVVFLTDGGPNPPYYEVDENGDRKSCPGDSAKGYCTHWKKFWDGSTNAAQVGQMNMAVCTDDKDPNPHWVRYRQKGSGFEQFVETSLTWADAAKTINMTPLLVMVGPRRLKHKADITCLLDGANGGGIVTPASFNDLIKSPEYQSAIINSLCSDTKLGETNGVLARWSAYQAEQESQLFAKFQEMAKLQQLSPAQTSSNYVYSGALVIGVGIAAFLYGKKSRAQDYMPLLSDDLMDTERV